MSENYSHILKYTGIFGGVQGISILVGIVRTKLVAVLLGTEGVGLASLFNSTIKLVGDSTNLGLSVSAVREISDAYEKNDAERLNHSIKLIRSWSLLTALLGMLVCLAASPLLNKWTFTWGDHTLHFVLLSPVVALLAITGGEMAVLKGTRRLRALAEISIYNVVASLLVTVPLYYFWREAAIVPVLFLVALVQMLLTIGYSYRFHPLHVSLSKLLLREGLGMVWLGVAFVLAGIMGSGADLVIRAYLNTADSLDAVGLYSAGYVMTMTYAGMVFSAMDTEFFPRLSGVPEVGARLNATVNSQIEVCMLLVSPMLVLFQMLLPILLPALYTGKFMPALGMMQVMVIAMFIRAVKLPISYLPLARGDSRSYLLMEGCYDVVVVALVILGFRYYGLTGAGVGITLASVFDFFMLFFYMRWRYQYKMSATVVRYIALQLPLIIASFVLTLSFVPTAVYWLVEFVFTVVSAAISLRILHDKTHLWEKLTERWKRIWKK